MTTMKFIIEESPFGDTGAVYEGKLAIFNHFRLQLISYRDQPKTPEERTYLEADIKGYEMLLESKSEHNAEMFMKYKRDENYRNRCADNTKLVEWLKANGHWESK